MREKKEPKTQAERIVAKFGNCRRLARCLLAVDPTQTRHPTSIYRWLYPRERGGTGGVIPTSAIPLILAAARIEGVLLTTEDFFPGPK